MTTKETVIGIWNDYEVSYLISIEELSKELTNRSVPWTAEQYCDRRYSVNLTRFNYDPYTGEKIDWKETKKLLEDLVKE